MTRRMTAKFINMLVALVAFIGAITTIGTPFIFVFMGISILSLLYAIASMVKD